MVRSLPNTHEDMRDKDLGAEKQEAPGGEWGKGGSQFGIINKEVAAAVIGVLSCQVTLELSS